MKILAILKNIIFVISFAILSYSVYIMIPLFIKPASAEGEVYLAIMFMFSIPLFLIFISCVLSLIHYLIGRKFESNRLGKAWLIINIIIFGLSPIIIRIYLQFFLFV